MAAIDEPFIRRRRQRAADRVLLRRKPREGVGVDGAALERDRRARLARLRHRFGVEQIAFDAIVAPPRIDRRDSDGRFLIGHEDALPALVGAARILRSEERRVGKECVSTVKYRWWPYP